MYGIARQGRFASRGLRLISSPSTSFLPRTTHLVSHRLPVLCIPQSRFSSLSKYRYNNAYAEDNEADHATADATDFGAEDLSNANREFTKFAELGEAGVINPAIVNTLVERMGIHTMTEVQRMTINECLDGSDVIAQAKTGTGKTLAFLMPIVQRIYQDIQRAGNRRPQIGDTRALIISPTRELAEQIAAEARKIVANTGLQVQTGVGGTQKSFHLRQMQQQGCHILVGTPGRIKDLLSDPRSGLSLDNIQTFVLDEADRLLDIGFGPDIEEIQSYMPPREERPRQTLMFSATIPRSVVGVVKSLMKPDFKFVRTVDPNDAATHETVPQKAVFLPGLQNEVPAIVEIAQKAIQAYQDDSANAMPFKAIIFLPSVAQVHLFHEILSQMRNPAETRGGLFAKHPLAPCKILVMSSRLSQKDRTQNSETFRRSESAILVSSDVSARGMDFPNVSHVIQVGLPKSIEDYVHRLGRTGRAGKSGTGYLILQHDERYQFDRLRQQIHIKNFSEEPLATADLDMTQPSQLPEATARIMKMVESGVRNVDRVKKAEAYQVMMTAMSQGGVRRSKQVIVDMVNENAKFGWGMETPPFLSSTWAQKSGFSGCQGLELREQSYGGSASSRGNYGGERRRSAFDQEDPFGQGISRGGRGTFGGDDRGGSGRESRGYGRESGGSGRESRGFGRGSGGYSRESGGYGRDRGRY